MESWAEGSSRSSGSASRPALAGALSLRSGSCSRWSRRSYRSRRCCSWTSPRPRSGPRTSSSSTRSCSSGAGGESGWSTSATASGSARDRRPDHRPSGRGCPGHVRRGRDVRERARHADDRSPASACVPRRHGPWPSEICLEVSGLEGDRFGPIDLAVHKGEILGSRAPKATNRFSSCGPSPGRALDRNDAVQRQRARRPVSARRASSGSRVPERRSGQGGPLPRPERTSEHDDSGLAQISARSDCSAAGASEKRVDPCDGSRSGGVDRAARPVSFGRKPAEGLAHASVPARLGAGDPRRRADPGRRRRLPFRHLRRAAGKGEGGGCDRRQVERPLELAGLCDRVAVMSRGRIVDEIPRRELSEQRIVEAIVGSRNAGTVARL